MRFVVAVQAAWKKCGTRLLMAETGFRGGNVRYVSVRIKDIMGEVPDLRGMLA